MKLNNISDPSKVRKILFLSPFFYPEQISTGKYNSFLVDKLLSNTFEVDVVALYPFYPDWVVTKIVEPFRNANIFRFGAHVSFPKSQVIRRIVLELMYSYYVIKFLLKTKKKYDIVMPVFPPVLFMMFAFLFLKWGSIVGIVHDVQGIMANTEKKFSRRFSASIMGFVEKLVYRKCNKLVCLSHSMKDAVIQKYGVMEEQCEVFYPFVSASNAINAEKISGLREIFDVGIKHIVYSGALGEKQQPFELYEFFLKLSSASENVKCHIFSRGPIFNELLNRSRESKGGVYFHDLVSEKDLDSLFYNSTVQVIPQSPGTGAGAFPSKLPNLLAHGVPVFAICDKGSELDIVLGKVSSAKATYSWDVGDMEMAMYDFLERIDGLTHEEMYLENKSAILKEFDVDRFIKSL